MSQPEDVYPYPVMRSQPDSSHSNGSYGPVFIVLAAIFVIAVVACVLGRLCSRRRHHHDKEAHHHQHHQVHHHPPPKSTNAAEQRQSRDLGPKEWEAKEKPRIALRERADVEFGFDRRNIPSARVTSHGGGMVEPPRFDDGRRPEARFDGGRRPEVRFADNV